MSNIPSSTRGNPETHPSADLRLDSRAVQYILDATAVVVVGIMTKKIAIRAIPTFLNLYNYFGIKYPRFQMTSPIQTLIKEDGANTLAGGAGALAGASLANNFKKREERAIKVQMMKSIDEVVEIFSSENITQKKVNEKTMDTIKLNKTEQNEIITEHNSLERRVTVLEDESKKRAK